VETRRFEPRLQGKTPVPGPDGAPITDASDCWLLDADGRAMRFFLWRLASVEDELIAIAYRVSDGRLVQLYCGERFGEEPATTERVEIEGLVEIPAGERTDLPDVDAAIDAYWAPIRARREAEQSAQRDRMAAFEAALGGLPQGDPVRLSFRYGEGGVEIWAGDRRVWADDTYPHRDCDLFADLRRLARERLGERLESFEVVLASDGEAMRYHGE